MKFSSRLLLLTLRITLFFPEKPEPVVYEVQALIVSGELVRVNVTLQIYITYPRI